MNTPISFKLAKLLQTKIYFKSNSAYIYRNKTHEMPEYIGKLIHQDALLCDMPAPTIAEVVMWLYEKHVVWIKSDLITVNGKLKFYCSYYKIHIDTYVLVDVPIEIAGNFDNPSEAYESAIEYTLNNLL